MHALLPLSGPIYTAKAMPLGLCASGKALAAAFESGRLELYAYEADGSALHSKPLGSLDYYPPIYSGAALCFDGRGRLWYQPTEEAIASFDPESGKPESYPLPGAEELSSLAAAGEVIYGTACAGRGTMLFCLDASGAICTRDLGEGDSRVLYADERGCLVTCAASGGGYPLRLVNRRLETLRAALPESPVTAAIPSGASYLLLPARQTLGQLWLWDGERCTPIEQHLLYQDQARLCRFADGSFALFSAAAVTRFAFEAGRASKANARTCSDPLQPEDLPDLSRYELRDAKLFAIGDYACVAGVSASMRSVRDEQCAGAVFLKKALGRWRVLGAQTWPRSYELVRAVCIDPEAGRFTLLFRSEDSIHWVAALQGTSEELCAGRGLLRELRLPQNRKSVGCWAGGRLFLGAGELLQVYEAKTLRYEAALVMPAPITAITPDGDRVNVIHGGQTTGVGIQEGAMR